MQELSKLEQENVAGGNPGIIFAAIGVGIQVASILFGVGKDLAARDRRH